MDYRPQARTHGLISERIDDDLVVYDKATQTAHSLSSAAASVWSICDGSRSASAIAHELLLQPELVERAISGLSDCGLLENGPADDSFMSRREAARKLARVGAAALAAPMIYSVAIGPAIAAASTCVANGTVESGCTASNGNTANDAKCCSGKCHHFSGGVLKCCGPTGAMCSGTTLTQACCSGFCFNNACT